MKKNLVKFSKNYVQKCIWFLKNKIMKVFILAGGFGTRLSQYTKLIPKPMIKVGGSPIIIHIMNHYCNFGFKEFYLATGNKKL